MPQIREQIAMVHLPPSKTLKYLFHVRKTQRINPNLAPVGNGFGFILIMKEVIP